MFQRHAHSRPLQLGLVALGLCIASNQAHADEKMDIGLMVGGHIFSKNLELGNFDGVGEETPQSSFAFGVRVSYRLFAPLRLEGELEIVPTVTRIASTDITVFGWRSHLIYDLMPNATFNPFLLAGVGAMTGAPVDKDLLEEDTDFGAHMGAGLSAKMGNNWGVRADARSLYLPSTKNDYLTVDYQFSLGLYKTFPAKPYVPPKDGDGDGVFDEQDECQGQLEDQDGFKDEDGCPDLDNDLDGIADGDDQCPADAETMNGVDDTDGCPEPDGDGDGVLGSNDLCPRQPEDKDGFADEDGCPEQQSGEQSGQ